MSKVVFAGDNFDMNPSFRRFRILLSCARLIPHISLVMLLKKEVFEKDITRWAEIYFSDTPQNVIGFLIYFVTFMTFTPEFRNLFYLRFGKKAKLLWWLCRPLESLEIQATENIGPGLFIQHGVCTLISAQRIGANCWINQQVTIGYSNKTDSPIIGDNVTIAPGAKLIGKIHVGNNVTIGPNTVVLDNVPSDVTVLGVPARIVSRRPIESAAN